METPITTLPIIDQIKTYLETNFRLVKLQSVDKASAFVAEILTDLIMVILGLLTFILLSITLALYVGQILGSGWEGFACVTVFYMLLVFAARLFKIKLRNLFIRLFIKKIFSK